MSMPEENGFTPTEQGMDAKDRDEGSGSVSKVKLVLGAASLFLFIVGVKRSFRDTGDSPAGPEGSDGDGGGTAPKRSHQERRRATRAQAEEERPPQDRRSKAQERLDAERKSRRS